MEKWQVHTLLDVSDTTGERREIGGSLVRMRIGAVNGPLHEISISPVSIEDMREECWDGQLVRLQVADRVAWLEQDEAEALAEMFGQAYEESLRNRSRAF